MFHNMLKEIWTEKLAELPWYRKILITIIRTILLTIRCFLKNQCMLRASALTFYSLLSLIPVAALAFAVAKGFGYETMLQEWLMNSMEGKEEVAQKIIVFAQTTLKNAKGGLIAGIGSLALLFITIRLLMQVENAMNDIWGIKQGRPILRKISEYLSVILLCPLAIVLSTGAAIFATAQFTGAVHHVPYLSDSMTLVMAYVAQFTPFVTTWAVFTFLYVFIPNTKVKIVPALLGGFVAGVAYYLVQTLYLAAQFTVTQYNAIYGSFAALPLFLIWMQMSWTLVLFGSQLAFALQNVNAYEGTPGDADLGQIRKYIYALKIVRLCACAFEKQLQPPSDAQISEKLEIPVRAARLVIFELITAGILVRVLRNDNSEVYQIARPPLSMTTAAVLKALQNAIPDDGLDPEDIFYKHLQSAWNYSSDSKMNVPLTELEFGTHYFHE